MNSYKIKSSGLIGIVVIILAISIVIFLNRDGYIDNNVTNTINSINLDTNNVDLVCELRFIDVGQGDACLVISDGYNILIDGGDNNKSSVVEEYLKYLGITTLDMIIATHPHADHIGGLDHVINNFEVKRVLMPDIPDETLPTTITFYDFLDSMDNAGITPEFPQPNDVYKFGKGEFVILDTYEKYNNLNDYSIVTKFTYDNNISTLFTGDCEEHKEEDLLLNYRFSDFESDILKVGHHGSSSSTTEEFYKAVDPDICVISCGINNKYNHPHDITLETISSNNAKVYRTDLQGNITIGIDIDGVYVTTER